MRFPHFAFATILTVLSGSTLWSCTQDDEQDSQTASLQTEDQPSSQAMPGGGTAMMQQLRANCPMVVQGADVAVSDTEGGVALTFTTDAPGVADLRTRARSMAQMYELHRGRGAMMWQNMGGEGMGHGSDMGGEGMGHGSGMGMGMGMGMGHKSGMGMATEHMTGSSPMPAASSTVTDTGKGVHIELRPTDASQLDALRQHVRLHQQRMHSGECWMLQEQPPAQGGQE